MVFPGVAQADVTRGDAQHVDVRDLRQLAGGIHPRPAVHAERKTHVVRMVVQHHQLEGLLRAHALQQRQAEVVEVATAEHYRAELGRQRCQHFSGETVQGGIAAGEAQWIVPLRQGQGLRLWQR